MTRLIQRRVSRVIGGRQIFQGLICIKLRIAAIELPSRQLQCSEIVGLQFCVSSEISSHKFFGSISSRFNAFVHKFGKTPYQYDEMMTHEISVLLLDIPLICHFFYAGKIFGK